MVRLVPTSVAQAAAPFDSAPLRRRRRIAGAATLRGHAPLTGASYGYAAEPIPPGSRRLGPMQQGDQGISASERPHAERAMKALFEHAAGVDSCASFDSETGEYEIRSRTGMVRWERLVTPTGDVVYRVTRQQGEDPIGGVDGTILATLEEEVAAAGGPGRPVPKEHNAYPDMLRRISQLFDNARAPEFVYIPTPGGDPNHPGAGSHGIPDIIQSRAPLVIAGPGVVAGQVVGGLVKHEDVAPTIADFLGVRHVLGTNGTGVVHEQLLRWQDGRSVASAVADAHLGAGIRGAAQRAVMFTVDGMSQNVMLDEVAKGHLPNIARIIQMGTRFRNGTLADYPTVTWANHNTLVTGASPGHNGLVNNSWYDRETQSEQLITDGSFKNSLRTGRHMSPLVETLYEAVERSFPGAFTMAINQPSGRGADISVLDLNGVPRVLGNIAQIAVGFLRGRSSQDKSMQSDGDYRAESMKDNFAATLGETFWSKRTPPKLGVFEFTLVDNQGHLKGPQHDHGRLALQEADRHIGRVLATLDRKGLTDETLLVLTADHGMEHQSMDPKAIGGWDEALIELAKEGTKTKESTRFVYVKNVRFAPIGPMPRVGEVGAVSLKVVNDDLDSSGARPAVGGATVTITDGAGHAWTGTTGADGVVQVPIQASAGPLKVVVEHPDFSREVGEFPLAGAGHRQ